MQKPPLCRQRERGGAKPLVNAGPRPIDGSHVFPHRRVRRFEELGVRVGTGGGGDLADDDDGGRQRRGAAEGGGGVPELADQHLKAGVKSRGTDAESPTHNCCDTAPRKA